MFEARLNALVASEEEQAEGKAPFAFEVDYGERAEHCWNGAHNLSNAVSRLRYNTLYLPRMLERMAEHSPPGADLESWRY